VELTPRNVSEIVDRDLARCRTGELQVHRRRYTIDLNHIGRPRDTTVEDVLISPKKKKGNPKKVKTWNERRGGKRRCRA
jgi:hypothetical protein